MGRTNIQWTTSGTRWQQGNHVLPHSVGWVSLLAILLMVYENNTIVTAEPSPQGPESTFVLQFDGTDDRVTVPYDASFPTEVFTASAWIKLPQPAGAGGQTPQVTSTRFCSLEWTSSGPKSNLEGRLVRGGRSDTNSYMLNSNGEV